MKTLNAKETFTPLTRKPHTLALLINFYELAMTTHPTRREFFIKVGAVSAVIAAGTSLSACTSGDSARFDYGVASGDPLADRVILWTHAKYPDAVGDVSLTYQVATDATFKTVVATGSVVAKEINGHTAKVDASGLTAGQTYFYRFLCDGESSPVGQTKTLPAGNVNQVKLAVLSCANYPAGYFNVYAEVQKSDADVAIHLGDYLYEYQDGGYPSTSLAGRATSPLNELLTLSDYRLRHAQYKSDPDLKQFHATKPMIAVWDDHEIANDAYMSGAENHTEGTEGTFANRKAAALKAYHEWMPIRTGSDMSKIYRSFDFGNLLSLHMLDTRLVGRDLQISITDLVNPATQASAAATLSSPTRQLLGAEQLTWLQGKLASSTATWQVLGQQVLMGRMEFPVSILQALNSTDTSPAALAAGQAAITDYLTAKATSEAFRTPTQVALLNPTLNPKLGYNLDAWDGYPAAREYVLQTAATLGKKLVVLAGDTHNAWHSDLTLLSGVKVGEEFATASVSSPGLETYLALPPAQVETIFTSVVDDLNWIDASRRGYLMMTLTPSAAKGDWYFVDTIASRTYSVAARTVAETRIYQPAA